MTSRRIVIPIALVGILALPALAHAAAQLPPMPKPGPEHDVLKMDEGTWDAVIEFTPAPGAPPMKSTGTDVDRIGCGGLCLITDFKGEMMPGAPFEGHGVATWDAKKKKYVGTWTDSISLGLAMSESTWDPAAKRMSGWMEGPDSDGKVVRMTTTSEYRDDGNTRVFTTFAPGPDGKNVQTMRITYTRRK